MNKLSIRDLELNDHRVFIRVDFNVPLEGGRVMDDTRIRETLPTIEYALRHGARVILASHLGRPKGKPDPSLSLKPVAERLRMLLDKQLALGENVGFCPDCVGPEAEEMAGKLEKGQTLLLENLRFHAEEEANDEKFSKQLAKLADYYVNDAFGAAHRAHASTVGITKFVQKAAAGLLMQKELEYLGKVLHHPEHPFVAILGGAKVSDKIGVIRNLMNKVDVLIIGGGMAYTFLKAHGEQVGKSLVEEDKVELARQLLQESKSHKLKFLLPVDHVVADKIDANAKPQIIGSGQPIPPNMMALDIGPRTIEIFAEEISRARTIVWNGPMGVFEVAHFAKGTFTIAEAIAENPGATSIVGGGDTVSAVNAAGVADKITHISTGGGASLEFLEGKKLPGVEALTNKRGNCHPSEANEPPNIHMELPRDNNYLVSLRIGDPDEVRIERADITKVSYDAIVNAANSEMLPGGGVCGAIHRMGGPAIAEECRRIRSERGPLLPGQAVATTAGFLPAKYVIHTVGPVWHGGNNREAETLSRCHRESMRLADELKLHSIAFPAISTGIFGYPVDQAAWIAVPSVIESLRPARHLVFVSFALFDQTTLDAFAAAAIAQRKPGSGAPFEIGVFIHNE